jgi:glycerol-1-phosphate dehydrogenase [NAD(P)+]
MLPVPMVVEIAGGVVARLPDLLADRRISTGGHVAVAVGPGLGGEIAQSVRQTMAECEVLDLHGGATLESALQLADRLRGGFYDALVAVGGGGTLDVAKHAATLVGLPLVAVATNVSHDGIASPVSSLAHGEAKASFGVQMPVAVLVDLDYVVLSPVAMRRAGVGDAISNLTALADWRLARRERLEPVDGLAVALAGAGATAVARADGSVDDVRFLEILAEALVLSGLAMATAGSSRPCSGADHEIVHAIDHLFPNTALHGELAAVGAVFAAHLHDDVELEREIVGCLSRHGLPLSHRDVGLTDEQFVRAVAHAPSTRPGRFTILEHRDLSEREIHEYVRSYGQFPAPVSPTSGHAR